MFSVSLSTVLISPSAKTAATFPGIHGRQGSGIHRRQGSGIHGRQGTGISALHGPGFGPKPGPGLHKLFADRAGPGPTFCGPGLIKILKISGLGRAWALSERAGPGLGWAWT